MNFFCITEEIRKDMIQANSNSDKLFSYTGLLLK